MIEGAYDADEAKEARDVEREEAKFDSLSEKQLDQRIRKLEKEMLESAKNLEFERAANLRDELKILRDRLMFVGGEG
jgi:excinuclease ABC subunit B